MDRYSMQVVGTVVMVIQTIALGAFQFWFFKVQFKKTPSWTTMWKNTFLRLTIIQAIAIQVDGILFSGRLWLDNDLPLNDIQAVEHSPGWKVLLVFNMVLFFVETSTHLTNVYLRCQPVVEAMYGTRWITAIRSFLYGYFLFAPLTLLFFCLQGIFGVKNLILTLSILLFDLVLLVCTLGTDLLGSLCFLKYARASKSAMGDQRFIKSIQATEIISRHGFIICILAFAALVIFLLQLVMDYLFALLLFSALYRIVGAMWMDLKVRLDCIKPTVTQNEAGLSGHSRQQSGDGHLASNKARTESTGKTLEIDSSSSPTTVESQVREIHAEV